jgi:hypothetical protein
MGTCCSCTWYQRRRTARLRNWFTGRRRGKKEKKKTARALCEEKKGRQTKRDRTFHGQLPGGVVVREDLIGVSGVAVNQHHTHSNQCDGPLHAKALHEAALDLPAEQLPLLVHMRGDEVDCERKGRRRSAKERKEEERRESGGKKGTLSRTPGVDAGTGVVVWAVDVPDQLVAGALCPAHDHAPEQVRVGQTNVPRLAPRGTIARPQLEEVVH